MRHVRQGRITAGLGRLVLFPLMLLCMWGAAAAFAGAAQVQIKAAYGQTEARRMLDRVNAFRTNSEEAWYWNEDNATKTQGLVLTAYQYDYGLEAVAMQRAMELAVFYAHDRADGTDCFALNNGYGARAENIAIGQRSEEAAFVAWREENDLYSGQGHRRAMLSSQYGYIGIGHVCFNGINCWVQEFSSSPRSLTPTAANDSESIGTIDVSETSVVSCSVATDQFSVAYGSSVSIPSGQALIRLTKTWSYLGMVPVQVPYTWTLAAGSESIVSLGSDGTVTGLKAGTATLTTTILGKPVTATVTVTPLPLSDAQVTVGAVPVYKGSAITPPVTVTMGGGALTEGTDYTVSYSGNTRPGTATVTVTGTGNYTGTVSRNFTIICEHSYTPVQTKAATCGEDGVTTYTCDFCADSYTEPIAATGNHSYTSVQTKAATCSKSGVTTYTCSVCGDSYTEPIAATGVHKYGAPAFKWGTDHKSATATFTCSSGGETKKVNAKVTSKTVDSKIVYTATAVLDQKTYKATASVKTVIKNKTYTSGSLKYKVTKVSGKKGTAKVTAPVSRSKTSLTIPKTVTINSVVLDVTAVADNAFKGMTKLRTVSVGSKVTAIGAKAFYGCTKLTKVTGCSGVTSVGSKAFAKCTKLTTVGSSASKVTLGKVKTIGDYAFSDCKSLKKVNLSSKALTGIGAGAFQNCAGLTKFFSSSSILAKIGKKAFYNCKKLVSVTFQTKKLTKSRVGSSAFTRTGSACIFYVPSSKASAYKTIFRARGAGSRLKIKKI